MNGTASPTPAPCGSWKSPITSDLIVGASTPIDEIAVAGDTIYWTERRPQEGGRNALVRRRADGTIEDLAPAPFSARSRAHEYGGGAFSVSPLGIFFCSFEDQRLHRLGADGLPGALTHLAGMRYADMIADVARNRLIAVREDHNGGGEAVNALVAIDVATGAERLLAGGHDFFSTPVLSPDGSRLAWLTWDHPNMPWDGTDLWVAAIGDDGTPGAPRHVAGGAAESIFQPAWSPAGELHFVSDRSGWWNLYRERSGTIAALQPMAAEFGMPQWVFGMSTYGFDGRGRIVCAYSSGGDWRLALLDPQAGSFETLVTSLRTIRRVRVGADFAVVVGGTPARPDGVVRIDLGTHGEQVIRSSSSAIVAPGYVAIAEAITFPTEGGREAHGFFYRPTNAAYRAAAGERPPLLVLNHGGPTSATDAGFNWSIQFWTSRGIGVVDVNYGGSSGYGRAYRQRLNGQWGVVDVDDAVNAAKYLVARGDADGERLAIRGGSAGGYTALCALTFRNFFKAGASHYGIGDLETLVRDTHKFEARYLDSLVGPYPAQQALYRARSPIHFTQRLAAAMILFQGADDKAVPPNQAEAMYLAVRAKGLPVAYLLFEGEGHGFRRAENIKRALEAELYFYSRIFGFAPADAIAPVAIENLPASIG
ncbi:MAG: S9 family peptidase [Betaproteobacteria bacterium]|nr:S9 family peptidase [Betaproteobacteria bacterium]